MNVQGDTSLTLSSNISTLVVDDSEFFASLTADTLSEEHGISTRSANTGNEALAELDARMPDCIVSDYEMPDMTGIDLYERVASEYGDVPFLLLTGRGDEAIASEAISAGIDEYLLKLQIVENEQYGMLAHRIRNAVSQRRSRERYELLVDNSPDQIAHVGVDGDILAVNATMAAEFSTQQSYLVGRSLLELLPESVGEHRVEIGTQAIADSEAKRFEDSYEGRYFHNIVVPVSERDADSFQLVSRDITTKKERERELETKTEKLAVVNRLLRHDIRNDIQLLTAWSDMIQSYVEGEGTQYVERIRETCDHIVELTRIGGEFVDSITGDETTELEPVNLGHVLREEIEKQRSSFPEATFTVDGEIPDTTVRANEMLSSVFHNLLNNAVRHNDTDDPEVTVTVDDGGRSVLVQIADDGPGVPDEQKEDIFGKGEMGPESPGSGIGLYLVYTLVEEFGGAVWVQDNDPRGAIFNVELRTDTEPTVASQ